MNEKEGLWIWVIGIFFLAVMYWAIWTQTGEYGPIIAIVVAILTLYVYFKFLYQPEEVYKREAIPDYIKEQVLKIQNNKCSYCGNQFNSPYEIDWHHIKPVAQGGKSDDIYNISALHSGCHSTLTRTRRY